MAREPAGLPISEVARRTRIPVTTLRFYERELPSLFQVRKTSGGHRRYGEREVSRFVTVRRLTEEQGLRLADVRRALLPSDEPDALREELDGFREAHAAQADALEALARRVGDLEARLAALETSGPPRRRSWLRRP
jgi:MerR family transcriptional regulator/heat shock protein HspR